MGIRDFLRINLQKLILFLFVIIFAPIPFYILFVFGLFPPIYFLVAFFANFFILHLILFILHSLIAYFFVCLICQGLSEKNQNKLLQWIIIGIIIILLIVLSFFNIYFMGNVGGSSSSFNILEIFKPDKFG